MPVFKIQEIREIVTTAEVKAKNAQHAMTIYKTSQKRPPHARDQFESTNCSDETHTTINELSSDRQTNKSKGESK